MTFFKNLLLATALFASINSLSAQNGPRLFLDVPSFYFAAPDLKNIGSNLGLGSDITMNIATHNLVVRAGGGTLATVDSKSKDLINDILVTPFVKLEAGAGRYRSNGNKCAKSHRPAFTTLAKAGVRYNFLAGNNRPEGTESGELDYTLGLEFGYFYIRDVIKNSEVFATADYNVKAQNFSLNAGFRIFFNLKGKRR
jgi:hypothetical protein